ncbi:DUF6069 family protein [Glycomyces buryatensis]|uniref:Uncharacterized protein n=1 Tax=Glycomyces buryatensis TaxID=2570927 RepID=A0A4S8QFM1_9ACTN|nr:DUF6069 family protein [Glycomyces buryatensis]THV39424.1 hypothetical protein FAB82_17550 [Glycomyces buryatensis]
MSAPQGGWDQPQGNDPTRRYGAVPQPQSGQRPSVDAGKLWAGGFGTAVVAALVALVGILLVRGVLDIAILSPSEAGMYGDASTTAYAFVSFAIAILATGVLHVLLLLMPRPMSFFNWIMLLAIAVAVLIPFTVNALLESQIATAAIDLVIGICIMSLLNSVAGIATRSNQPPGAGA